MLYLTCTTITSIDLAYYVSRAKDWVSVDCGTSFNVFCFRYRLKKIVILIPHETLLPSPGCLINTVLACLIKSPVSGSNVVSKCIPTCSCSSSATWKTNLVHKDFFASC